MAIHPAKLQSGLNMNLLLDLPSKLLFAMKILSLLFTLCCCTSLSAQIILYKSYADYKAGTGENVGKYVGTYNVSGTVRIQTLKDGKKEKVKLKGYWGFTYKDHLFRVTVYNNPAMLIKSGKICYYENGAAHMDMLNDATTTETFITGYSFYFSQTEDSELYALPAGDISNSAKRLKSFQKEHPEHVKLFDCIGKNYYLLSHIRNCVEGYQGQ